MFLHCLSGLSAYLEYISTSIIHDLISDIITIKFLRDTQWLIIIVISFKDIKFLKV